MTEELVGHGTGMHTSTIIQSVHTYTSNMLMLKHTVTCLATTRPLS